jgi:hypothetical protein
MQVVNSHAYAGFISPTNGGPALVLRETQFVRTRLGASKKVGAELEAKFAGEGPGDELGLVIAALAETCRVKRYWNDDVGGKLSGVARGKVCKAISEPGGEGSDSIVFYEEDRANHGVIVVGEAAGEAEAVSLQAAEAAEKVRRVSDLRGDDRTAARSAPRR